MTIKKTDKTIDITPNADGIVCWLQNMYQGSSVGSEERRYADVVLRAGWPMLKPKALRCSLLGGHVTLQDAIAEALENADAPTIDFCLKDEGDFFFVIALSDEARELVLATFASDPNLSKNVERYPIPAQMLETFEQIIADASLTFELS